MLSSFLLLLYSATPFATTLRICVCTKRGATSMCVYPSAASELPSLIVRYTILNPTLPFETPQRKPKPSNTQENGVRKETQMLSYAVFFFGEKRKTAKLHPIRLKGSMALPNEFYYQLEHTFIVGMSAKCCWGDRCAAVRRAHG